ncbi:MAG: hypothetical protein ABSF52_24035 [Syntrophobacteraceae bacterium]|jgi:hypothetical protein
MTKQELLEILKEVKKGVRISGTVAGKFYTFKGIEKYSGKGRYPHFKGIEVVALQSDKRKRGMIILFPEPLLLLVNADLRWLRYGRLPEDYIYQCLSGEIRGIPNVYEYESHYKSVARYIKGLTRG